MKRLTRAKLVCDAVYWIASAVKEIANAAGELILIYRRFRKKK